MKNRVITISSTTLIAILIGFVIGYFLGKSSVEIPKGKVEKIITYSQGKTITKTISVPEPYAVHDTTYQTIGIPAVVDTAALYEVWCDYYLARDYELDFSEDTLGVFKVNASVTQNKLVSATSTIKPLIRTETETKTIYKVPTIQFYTLIGTSLDLQTNQIQAGVDLKQKYLIGVSGIRRDNDWGYTFNLGIKF